MENIGYMPEEISCTIPKFVLNELDKMPANDQIAFLEEYQRKVKSKTMAYFFWLLLGSHYIYLKKIWLQLLMWLLIIFVIGIVWWVIDLFRISGLLRDYNKDIAMSILREIRTVSGKPDPFPDAIISTKTTKSDTAKVTKKATDIIVAHDSVKAAPETVRVYHAPRLDDAFNAQDRLKTNGKYTAPILTVLCFAGGPVGALAVIGLIAYWISFINNKNSLEKAEMELHRDSLVHGLRGDITSFQCFWFKYGPPIAYLFSIVAVVYLVVKWVLVYMWNHTN